MGRNLSRAFFKKSAHFDNFGTVNNMLVSANHFVGNFVYVALCIAVREKHTPVYAMYGIYIP